MKKWTPVRWIPAAVAVVCTAGAVTGCATDGQAVSITGASSSATTPSIDVAALDTGGYPTSPRPPFGESTQENIQAIEGQRMAQYVLVPFEVDADLTRSTMPTYVITGARSLLPVMATDVADVPANSYLVGGFVSTAGNSTANLRSGTARALNNVVLRYLTPADALAAARQMAEKTAAFTKTEVTTLPGLPNTLVIRGSSGDNRQIMAFTPHRSYLLYQWYQTTTAQQDRLEPTIRKAVELQTPMIDRFPATPTKAESAAGNTNPRKVMIDQNHILIYALPYTDDEMTANTGVMAPGATRRAVYGPRGMAHTSNDPVTDFRLLTDVGSTANASEKSVVYRATTDAGATTILDTFVASSHNRGWTDISGPPGLPIARCQVDPTGASFYHCLVQVGRYVGEVSLDDKQDTYRQISAQYVILTKADQNAN